MQKIPFLLAICLLLAQGFAGASAQPGSADALVVRIYYAGPAQLQQLADRLDVWAVQPQQGTLTAQVSPAELAQLRAAGWRVEVDEALTRQSTQAALLVQSSAADALNGVPGYPCYRTVEETFTALGGLEANYPALAQRVDIGDSWIKHNTAGAAGYDLWLLRLTNLARPAPKPRLFVMGEIHAREMTTAETVLRLGEFLLQNYNSDPEITWLLDENEIYLLPMTNPDGRKQAETGLPWRKNVDSSNLCNNSNAYGVDLNRNSSFHWGGAGSSADTCADIYRGPSAASEPEVQALQNYLSSLYPDRRGPLDTDPAPADTEGLLISLHSYGGLVLWPYGWTTDTPAPNGPQLAALGGKLAYLNGYHPQQASALYVASGGTDDWVYGSLGLASYTIEMGTQFFESCASFESTVWPANRAALLYAAKAARRPYQAPAGPEVVSPQVSPAAVNPGMPLTLTAVLSGMRSANSDPRNIQAGRYTFDLPSWKGGVTHNLTAADGAFNSPVENTNTLVETCGLAAGRHTLFVEAQSANGAWGVPSAVFFSIGAPVSQGRGLPGTWVSYPLTICNTGPAAESYTLKAVSLWETSLPTGPIGPVAAGAGASLSVKVRIPAGAPGGTSMPTQVTWAPLSQPDQTTGASLITFANWAAWLVDVRK